MTYLVAKSLNLDKVLGPKICQDVSKRVRVEYFSVFCNLYAYFIVAFPIKKNFYFSSDINTILKFAIMEFRFGDSQKGVTMFESVLKNHPKRTDIWSVYVDMMIKHDQVDSVR